MSFFEHLFHLKASIYGVAGLLGCLSYRSNIHHLGLALLIWYFVITKYVLGLRNILVLYCLSDLTLELLNKHINN